VSVSQHDRDDYEEGLRDREKGVLDQALNDITVNHPDSDAYYKGRRGEQLDEDKDRNFGRASPPSLAERERAVLSTACASARGSQTVSKNSHAQHLQRHPNRLSRRWQTRERLEARGGLTLRLEHTGAGPRLSVRQV
jgi:hypothetical protein